MNPLLQLLLAGYLMACTGLLLLGIAAVVELFRPRH